MKRDAPVFLAVLLAWLSIDELAAQALPNTAKLTAEGDLSKQMVDGIRRYLLVETASSVTQRTRFWQRDFSSEKAYNRSLEGNRNRLRQMIGAVDPLVPNPRFQVITLPGESGVLAEAELWRAYQVRWPVIEGVEAEGLLLRPKNEVKARVVALPDADQAPELICGILPGLPGEQQWARRLAEHGCEVLIMEMISRSDEWSGSQRLAKFTNQPHREWIYRQAYEVGRHIIGYEVLKVLAGAEAFQSLYSSQSKPLKLGLAGYAEGGMIALYAAAVDPRFAVTLVSGYFDKREQLWREPIYRNVFGLLREFGDAELASMISPRQLIIEHSEVPRVIGPPPSRQGRSGAAPGKLVSPDYGDVESEVERANTLSGSLPGFSPAKLVTANEGMTTLPISDPALANFLVALGFDLRVPNPSGTVPPAKVNPKEVSERQKRQVEQLKEFTQRILRQSQQVRQEHFWGNLKRTDDWTESVKPERERFHRTVIGLLDGPAVPMNARARDLQRPTSQTARGWHAHEVVLDVRRDIFAWGYLLVPHNLAPGERRPVVVCQHGLEGLPGDVIDEDPKSKAYGYYRGFGAKLADAGYVVFAPHNPYRGGDNFRELQRIANPLGLSLFSIITAQHERILEFLQTLPFVDRQRIGFYGLSYGGKTAMRVPALLEGYALSVCSGDFNDWVSKNASVDFPGSYMFSGEYEMPEFNLGLTFNYAEMAALIAPRPFMVERGHDDPVGIDEWVASEYATVRRLYSQLGLAERTRIEFFAGGHQINAQGTFEFLRQHMGWPRSESK
jgi:dienelactone hydrolase